MAYPEPTVSAVIFNPDRHILLCRSHKWENTYVIPGGHIEWGESMEEALKREIMEETGLTIYDIRLIGLKECINSQRFHQPKHFIFIDYICRTDSYQVRLNDEAEAYAWVPLDRIHEYPLGGYTGSLLDRIADPDNDDHRQTIFYNY
ncbi:MAG: NUDIX domain-containing protein [Candidatus Delongbacteria bacterium]|nr:NUDIX domain-containing protein [Candidatus Delongbacteria bacterium]